MVNCEWGFVVCVTLYGWGHGRCANENHAALSPVPPSSPHPISPAGQNWLQSTALHGRSPCIFMGNWLMVTRYWLFVIQSAIPIPQSAIPINHSQFTILHAPFRRTRPPHPLCQLAGQPHRRTPLIWRRVAPRGRATPHPLGRNPPLPPRSHRSPRRVAILATHHGRNPAHPPPPPQPRHLHPRQPAHPTSGQ